MSLRRLLKGHPDVIHDSRLTHSRVRHFLAPVSDAEIPVGYLGKCFSIDPIKRSSCPYKVKPLKNNSPMSLKLSIQHYSQFV